MTEKIKDIINRELIVRTNNVNYLQEYGTVGTSNNIGSGVATIFSTKYKIHKIAFVTINGITQVEGVNYFTGDFTITFSGVILPEKIILVGYYYEKELNPFTKTPPRILDFSVTPDVGSNGLLKFKFSIEQNSGVDILWTIHRDGRDTRVMNSWHQPLEGEELLITPDDGNMIEFELSYDEYIARTGDSIPFTLIVTYNYADENTKNEKLLASTAYVIDDVTFSILHIAVTPNSVVSEIMAGNFAVTYSIDKGSFDINSWIVKDNYDNTIASGSQGNYPSGPTTAMIARTFVYGTPSLPLYLIVNEGGRILNKSTSIINNIRKPVTVSRAARVPMMTVGQYIVSRETYIQNVSAEYFTLTDIDKPVDNVIPTPFLSPVVYLDDDSAQKTIFEVPRDWGNPVAFFVSGLPVAIEDFNVYLNINDALDPKDIIDAYIEKEPKTVAALITEYSIKTTS